MCKYSKLTLRYLETNSFPYYCFISWRAYDSHEGIEVAWNVVKLSRVPPSERKRIKTEISLLKDIEHRNVIKYHNSWINREREEIIFITEIMSSGSLKE
jgi:WNK lysine deficient protein kinase